MKHTSTWSIPHDIPKMLDYVYKEDLTFEDYSLYQDLQKTRTQEGILAGRVAILEPFRFDEMFVAGDQYSSKTDIEGNKITTRLISSSLTIICLHDGDELPETQHEALLQSVSLQHEDVIEAILSMMQPPGWGFPYLYVIYFDKHGTKTVGDWTLQWDEELGVSYYKNAEYW